MKEQDNNKQLKYTVYEYKDTGSRYLTSYNAHNNIDNLIVVGHAKIMEDAQKLCSETEILNFFHYILSLPDALTTRF